MSSEMTCPKCKSSNVTVSASATEKKAARHGALYWIFIGWWWHAILWLFLTLPMIIYRLIFPNRKTKTMLTTHAVCKDCGETWIVDQKRA